MTFGIYNGILSRENRQLITLRTGTLTDHSDQVVGLIRIKDTRYALLDCTNE